MGNASVKNNRRYSSSTRSNFKRVQWGGPEVPAPPGKPILIAAASEDSQPDIVGIRWERSPSNGGSAIVGYLVEHRRLGSPHWVRSSPNLCSFPELTLSGLEPGWRYQFRVRARNNLGLSPPSELSDPLTVTLQRSAASPPYFDLELKDTIALENEQAEFVVHFSGTSIPKISWFKDGFEIFSSRRTRIVTENGKSTLLIHQTALNDEGEIKCTATNRAGHVSTRANLILEALPRIRLPRQYEDGLLFEQDETIRLKVSVAGRPPPNVFWLHNGEIVKSDDGHMVEALESGECSLRIPAAKRKDRGEYTVKAVNKLGEDVISFLVTITDRPAAPGKVTIAMTLGRTVTLSWQEPEDDGGCKIGTYIVEYYRIGWDVWLKAATCRQTMTTLSELIEGSEYKFRIKAENPYGVSDPSAESDVIFIPDSKRGINSPPLRPDKSQSQREIHRGRSARRDQCEPTKRTRSLTREEVIRSSKDDEFQCPPSRSTSAQRLIPGAPIRPVRTDSRVTFSDIIYLHLEKPLKDDVPMAPVRPRSKRDKIENLIDNEDLVRENIQENNPPGKTLNSSLIIEQPTFNNSRAKPICQILREKPPSPIPMIRIQQSSVNEPTNMKQILAQEADMGNTEEDDDRGFHGSSEFMLVLYPDEEVDEKIHLKRSVSENDVEDDDEDLVPPPMSLSLPELFSANHQVVEVLREAVSSTELLHERAMERFYKAVAIEEAEAAKINDEDNIQKLKVTSNFSSGRSGNYKIRRISTSYSSTQSGYKAKWIKRRSSDGQTSAKIPHGIPSTLLLPAPKLAASDPNLPQDSIDEVDFSSHIFQTASPTAISTGLHRWDDKTMPLIPVQEQQKQTSLSRESLKSIKQHIRDVKTPNKEIGLESSNAEYYEESTDAETDESVMSDSSEDLKTLKLRLLAQPIVDEQDTYHPHGRPIAYIASPEPDYKIIIDNSTRISTNNVIQPKSILKKRIADEPVLVNHFGRPIPPEKLISEEQHRTKKSLNSDSDNAYVVEEPPVIFRKKSLVDIINPDEETVMSELDSDNASLLNAAEFAKNRRRFNQKPILEKKTSIEEQEDFEARMAVIDHYTEIVKEYSLSHSVHPPTKISSNGALSHGDKMMRNKIDPSINYNQMKQEEDVVIKKEEVSRTRKSSVDSRCTTPSRDDVRPIKKASRNESPIPKSKNVSNERKRGRSNSETRIKEVSQDRGNSRSSSKTRKREVSQDKEVLIFSSSSSKQRPEKIPKNNSFSRTNSKDKMKSFDISPSDSETSQRMTRRKNNNYNLERSRSGSSKTIERLDNVKTILEGSSNGINDRLVFEANNNVRSMINYTIDLTLFFAAVYIYLFKKEILAIPLIGLLLYRRIQEDIRRWIPKRWKGQPK